MSLIIRSPRARKVHQCMLCGCDIRRGERYDCHVVFCKDSIRSDRICLGCPELCERDPQERFGGGTWAMRQPKVLCARPEPFVFDAPPAPEDVLEVIRAMEAGRVPARSAALAHHLALAA